MSHILDDISFEDVKNNTDVQTNDDDYIKAENQPYHIEQIFCRIQRKRDVLLFALVRFGGYQRYDIRLWYDNESKPGKGISLTAEELKKLKTGLEAMDLSEIEFEERAYYTSDKVHAIIFNQICILDSYSIKSVKWNKEVNIVDFGYGKKVDLRKWSADYSVCGKGVAISFQEAQEIIEAINNIF